MKELPFYPELIVEKLDRNVLLSVALASVVIPIIHMLLHRYVITPVGHRWCRIAPGKTVPPGSELRLQKFQQSCWKTIVYTVLVTGSAYALSKETFWSSTREFWTGCEQRMPCAYQASPEMKFAYSLEAAYIMCAPGIMYAIPYATFMETRRKDFYATMAHHWVTFLLIFCSYAIGFTKVGLVMMFIHDVADPFLEVAKMGNYAMPMRKQLTNICFVIFALLWILLRDVYFPGWVIHGVLFHAVHEVVGDTDPTRLMWIWYVFASLLIALLFLHLFWTYTIVRIALTSALGGRAVRDTREDGDGSSTADKTA